MKCSCLSFLLIATSWAAVLSDDFSKKLYQLIAEEHPNTNLVVSPFAIKTLLSQLYAASEGSTAEELRTALGLHANKTQGAELYRKKFKFLKVTNSIRVPRNHSLKPSLKDLFQSEHEKSNDAGSLNQKVRAEVTSEVQFQNVWTNPFSVKPDLNIMRFNGTREIMEEFMVSNTKSVRVPMYHTAGMFFYSGTHSIDLQYSDSGLWFRLFRLSENEQRMASLPRATAQFWAFFKMPKFEIELEQDMVAVLRKLGIQKLFSEKADLNIFSNGSRLMIDKVSHKVRLEIRLQSTDAAVFTKAQAARTSPRNSYFKQPFGFLIMDENNTYFQGRVYDPSIKVVNLGP